MGALLGCIADDFTGGTDLAGMLVKSGMRTVQMIGVPTGPLPDDIDAVVIALKSRTAPVAEAISESLAALRYLQAGGCRQFYFKYCSTFNSTPRGNIGPVAEALMDALGADFTIACPAFPANQRTIYKGYLFVGDVLLNESGMRDHPLTPMTDANLVRVLQQQTTRKVGLVDYAIVSKGATAILERFGALRRESCGFAIVDALSNDDLHATRCSVRRLCSSYGGLGPCTRAVAELPEPGPPLAECQSGRAPSRRGLTGGDCGQLLDCDAKAGGHHARASSRVPSASGRPRPGQGCCWRCA